MVATAVLLLVHVPPVEASLNDAVEPVHILLVPAIADGNGLTVTTDVDIQLADNKYVIVAVPDAVPVTTPVDATVATLELLLLHVPLPAVLVNVVVDPAQT
jgi:hypothetical protein